MARAGMLRDRMAIQAATEAQDGHGQAILTWATTSTRWARYEPLQGRALFEAQQVDNRITARVLMRRFAGLTPQHRLLFGTRILNIVAVPDAGYRQPMLAVMVSEDT